MTDEDKSWPDIDLYTVRQLARRLNCSERHVWRLIQEEEIEVVRHRRLTRVTGKAILEFIERNKKRGR